MVRNEGTSDCAVAPRERRAAQNTSGRRGTVNGRIACHGRYAGSQQIRKRVKEIFRWMMTVRGFRRTRDRDVGRAGLARYLVATAYNLVRVVRLPQVPEEAVPVGNFV